MKKQTLSVVLAVKNEEKNIEKCLEAVKWADEIIIIDNQSIDKTVEIAKKYTNKIYYEKKKILISLLQNEGIKKATKDWVLILDADVIVPKETAKEIQNAIQSEVFQGYYLCHKTYIMGKCMKSDFWSFDILKLFKRKCAIFQGKSAHEPISFEGKCGKIKLPLFHYTHPSLNEKIRKMNLYTSQDAKILHVTQSGGILKRKVKNITLYNLLFEPFIYGLYLYIYRKGYKDGIHGFIVDILMGFYVFIESSKVWEIEQWEKT